MDLEKELYNGIKAYTEQIKISHDNCMEYVKENRSTWEKWKKQQKKEKKHSKTEKKHHSKPVEPVELVYLPENCKVFGSSVRVIDSR